MNERKNIRLRNYDYSQNGAYFVTICTQNRECLFKNVGADSISAQIVHYTLAKTIKGHPGVSCPKYVIMPDHFHAIIVLERADMESAPTLSRVIQAFKRYSTIEYTKAVKQGILPPYTKRIWQRGYYEHVIRNDTDYLECWKYIDENPLQKDTHL